MQLNELKEGLEHNQDLVCFSLFYDRKNKKFLAWHQGDEEIIEKMLRRAATTNGFFATMLRKVSSLFGNKIPKPQREFGETDFFDIFDKFKH